MVNKKLGSGVYGIVYRGFLAEDEKVQVAVKTIPIKVNFFYLKFTNYSLYKIHLKC